MTTKEIRVKVSADTRQANRAIKSTGKELEGLKKSADAAGGKLGEIGGRVQNAAEAFTALSSPTGALAATVAGIGLLGAAGLAAAANMSTLIAELDKMGATARVTDEQRIAAQRTDEALNDLKETGLALALVLGEDFAPAIQETTSLIVGFAEQTKGAADAIAPLLNGMRKVGRVGAAIGTLGLSEVMESYRDSTIEAGEAARQAAEHQRHFAQVTTDGFESVEDVAKRNEERAKKEEQEAKKRASDAARRQAEQLKREQEAERARRADMDRRVALSRAMRAEEAEQDAERAEEQRAEMQRLAQAYELKKQADQEAIERKQEEQALNRQAVSDLVVATADASALIVDLIDTRTKAGKKAAMVAFRVNQGLNLASAIGNTAAGITQALATLPPPASFLTATAIGTTGAAQIAKIASTRPQFHRGTAGSPEADEMLLRQGERAAILTSQAQEAGAAEAVNRGNAGLSVGDTALTLQVDHRYFDAQVSSASRRAGSGLRRMERRNRRAIGHSRRSRK